MTAIACMSQRHTQKTFAARFECDDMLAGGEDNPPERNHPFLADRLTNNSERLLADFAIRSEVIRAVEIKLVDDLNHTPD